MCEISFRVRILSGGLTTCLSLTTLLFVLLFLLLGQESLAFDLQIEALGHVWDYVSDGTSDNRNEPLEDENESQPCSQDYPIDFAVIVRFTWIVKSRVSEKTNLVFICN